jgi:hypothetical protein
MSGFTFDGDIANANVKIALFAVILAHGTEPAYGATHDCRKKIGWA